MLSKSLILLEEVEKAQETWGKGIVSIGEAFQQKENFSAVATNLIEELYAYQFSPVLFKPTKAADDQFRESFDKALSYFVASNGTCSEDKGFALQPWTNVRFENHNFVLKGEMALVMGNYYFTTLDGDEVKVEYTFGYVRDDEGQLRICLHHSSLPFTG